jgi:DNA-directed RNA polymerase specialized sigma24 family protein
MANISSYMGVYVDQMTVSAQMVSTHFIEFFRETEPRLRLGLCAAFGTEVGSEAASYALSYGWEHWSRVSELENPAGYLWGVGRNRARRLRAQGLRWRRSMFEPVRIDHLPWIEPGLPVALAHLSERQRTAVVLVHGLGWTLREVAELLEISVPTVQKHAERGLVHLRKELGAEL